MATPQTETEAKSSMDTLHLKKMKNAPRSKKKQPRKPATVDVDERMHAVCLARRGVSQFTCGIDDRDALLVEESLDERERKG